MFNSLVQSKPKSELRGVCISVEIGSLEYPDSSPENSGSGTRSNLVSGPDNSGFDTGKIKSGIIFGCIPGETG